MVILNPGVRLVHLEILVSWENPCNVVKLSLEELHLRNMRSSHFGKRWLDKTKQGMGPWMWAQCWAEHDGTDRLTKTQLLVQCSCHGGQEDMKLWKISDRKFILNWKWNLDPQHQRENANLMVFMLSIVLAVKMNCDVKRCQCILGVPQSFDT